MMHSPWVLQHHTTVGGTSQKITSGGGEGLVFMNDAGNAGLAEGWYYGEMYQITKTVNIPVSVCNESHVWTRTVGATSGWSAANPNNNLGHSFIVSQTSSTVTLRTFVYYIKSNSLGQTINTWYPTSPQNVTMAYTTLINSPVSSNMITGPSFVCTTNTTLTLSNPPTGSSVTWAVTPTNLFGTTSGASTSGSGTTATLRALNNWSSGQATITFTVTSSCGGPVNVQKTFWVGGPAAQGIDISNVDDPMGLCPYTQYIVEAYGFAGGGPITEYEWLIPSGWTSVQGGSQNPFTHNDALVQLTTTASGPGFIRVMAKNEVCGYGPPFFLWVDTQCSWGLMSVYPNPSASDLFIEYTANETSSLRQATSEFTVQLLNLNGRLQKSGESESGKAVLDIKDIPDGLYVLRITTPQGTEHHHISIKR